MRIEKNYKKKNKLELQRQSYRMALQDKFTKEPINY